MAKITAICKSEDKNTDKEAVVGCVRTGDDVRIKNNGQ